MTQTNLSPAALIAATRDRIGGSRLAALRVWLHETDARCVSCGFATRLDVAGSHPLHAELGHMVAASTYAASNARVGWLPGNIALMCHTCNADANTQGVSFTLDMLIPGAHVPTEWPTLRSRRMADTDAADASRAARSW